jgi:hypothetical protein
MLKQQTNKSTTIIDFYQCDNNAFQLNNSLFGHDNTFVIVIAIAIAIVMHKLLITIMLKQKVKIAPDKAETFFDAVEEANKIGDHIEAKHTSKEDVEQQTNKRLKLIVKRLESVITKDNFPEFKSLCLDFNGAYTYVDGSPRKKVNIHVPTKYFIGATPIQPSNFFESRSIKFSLDGPDNFIFNIPSMHCESGWLPNDFTHDCMSRTGKNVVSDALQWYDTFFSNFYDRITIVYRLKDNIFNIPVKRFINIRKKFDELFLNYIKQVYNENVLKILKRNVIDQYINTVLSKNRSTDCVDELSAFLKTLFRAVGERDESRYFNDFIIQNLTIDFFAESDEDED